MKDLLLAAFFGVITHYSSQHDGPNANANEHSGALTRHYGKDAKYRRAVDRFIEASLEFIQRDDQPETQPE